jgi:3-oxoacyl-[acyl-carrier-protein] synthase-3
LDDSVRGVLRAAELSQNELDLIVLHQANVRIIDAAVEMLQLDRAKLVMNLDRYGNTSSGSVPLALDEANQQGRVRRGDRILLSGFGAGLAWGTAVLRW